MTESEYLQVLVCQHEFMCVLCVCAYVCMCVGVRACVRTLVCVYVCLRWSAVPEFGRRVNNYSAYSVIMVPVRAAAALQYTGPCRLRSMVMNGRR